MKKWYGILLICPLLLIAACQSKNNNTPYPQITLKGVSPETVKAESVSDSLFISFDFFDGDGDISEASPIKLVDSRTNDSIFYYFPKIDPSIIDPATGIQGTTLVKIQAAILHLRADSAHAERDTFQYKISIRDNAGNQSNTVTTPNIYLIKD